MSGPGRGGEAHGGAQGAQLQPLAAAIAPLGDTAPAHAAAGGESDGGGGSSAGVAGRAGEHDGDGGDGGAEGDGDGGEEGGQRKRRGPWIPSAYRQQLENEGLGKKAIKLRWQEKSHDERAAIAAQFAQLQLLPFSKAPGWWKELRQVEGDKAKVRNAAAVKAWKDMGREGQDQVLLDPRSLKGGGPRSAAEKQVAKQPSSSTVPASFAAQHPGLDEQVQLDAFSNGRMNAPVTTTGIQERPATAGPDADECAHTSPARTPADTLLRTKARARFGCTCISNRASSVHLCVRVCVRAASS